jgi:predicted metal-dependent peptidase
LFAGEGQFAEYESGLSAEQYFVALKEKYGEEGEDEGQGKGGGGEAGEGQGGEDGLPDSFDDHTGWGEGDNTSQEIAKQRLKEAIKKAAKEASKCGNWGTVSSSCKQEILDRIVSKVDWKKVLRYFIKTSQRASKSSTIKRINRRYPYVHPGKKITRRANIAISIDQSGSVDDGMLAAFFSELNKLAKLAEFTVIPFDSEVAEESVYVWKKGESRKWERVRYGGYVRPQACAVHLSAYVDDHILLCSTSILSNQRTCRCD